MPIPRQQAAQDAIIELLSRWEREDVAAIVSEAEKMAERSGSPELTRVHIQAAETYYQSATGSQPKFKRS
jgi:hypothetical protein